MHGRRYGPLLINITLFQVILHESEIALGLALLISNGLLLCEYPRPIIPSPCPLQRWFICSSTQTFVYIGGLLLHII